MLHFFLLLFRHINWMYVIFFFCEIIGTSLLFIVVSCFLFCLVLFAMFDLYFETSEINEINQSINQSIQWSVYRRCYPKRLQIVSYLHSILLKDENTLHRASIPVTFCSESEHPNQQLACPLVSFDFLAYQKKRQVAY